MKHQKKEVVGIIILIILIIILIFVENKFPSTGQSIGNQEIKVAPLNSAERAKVTQALSSNEFIKDIPENDPVSLRFFKFEKGQRVWQDSFLIGKDQLLLEGEPSIYLTLHSNYISELNQNNLCEVMKRANKNRDLGFYTEYSKAKLFLKYSSMLKHRRCIGF